MSDIKISGCDVLSLVIRYLLCLVFPPLAVLDKGCGSVLLVLLFTILGWIPGTILAFLICLKDKSYYLSKNQQR